MSTTESPISLTVKINGDLFTVRGDNPAEFNQRVAGVIQAGVIDHVAALQEAARTGNSGAVVAAAPAPTMEEAVANVSAAFPGAVEMTSPTVAPPPPPTPAGFPQVQTPQPVAATNGAPACQHGPKQFKSGTGRNGKPWQAWMCPAPKGTPDQCAPEWVR